MDLQPNVENWNRVIIIWWSKLIKESLEISLNFDTFGKKKEVVLKKKQEIPK